MALRHLGTRPCSIHSFVGRRVAPLSLLWLSHALVPACTVNSGDDDTAGAAGEGAQGGTSHAGASGKGGSAGKSGAGGSGGTAGNSGAAGETAEAGQGGNGGSGGATGGGAGVTGESGNGGEGGASEPAVEDPAPFANDPGESKSCDGAPDTDVTVFEHQDVNETTMSFNGTVTGADGIGTFYVASATEAISGPIPTDADSGAFDVTLPLFCGEQTVKLVWKNAGCIVAAVVRVVRVDCETEGIRLTLSWDDLGRDFELHLIKEGGRINDNATDCTWTSCLDTGPDWGKAGDTSDNPHKDVDNTGSFGPENIYYATPEPGTYTVMVEHWGAGSADADGQVVFNVAGTSTVATIENLPSESVWTVGTVEWPSGKVTTSTQKYDCSGNWSAGCRDVLP